jgi:hypothetical protein
MFSVKLVSGLYSSTDLMYDARNMSFVFCFSLHVDRKLGKSVL